MSWRAAILHPVGVAVLGLSIAVALAMAVLPQLYLWSSRSGWALVWGLAAYGTIVAAFHFLPSSPPTHPAELRPLLQIRGQIAGRLNRLRDPSGAGRRIELESILEDALRQIDDQITPKMSELLGREADLRRKLDLYDGRKIPLPDRPHLERLETIHERQRKVIEACVLQAANADATLEAILQEGNDAEIAERARVWADDLVVLHDAIREVIQDEEAHGESDDVPVPAELGPILASAGSAEAAPVPDAQFVAPLEEALRRLNNIALLARSGLVPLLPHTLVETMHARVNGLSADPTPTEQAHALQKVLIDGIERLKPLDRDDGVASESIQYHILHEEYVEDHPTKWILGKYAISESTFHRHRRQAIDCLAADLAKQEERFAHEGPRVAPRS